MKLKTLNDIKNVAAAESTDPVLSGIFRAVEESWKMQQEQLRAEAIKWVKHYRTTPDGEVVSVWIQNFFNLTEEDL